MKLIQAGLIAVASAFLGLASVGPSAAQRVDDLGNVIIPNGHPQATSNWRHGHRYQRQYRPRYDHRPRYRPRYHRPRTNFYLEFNVPSSRYVAPRRVIRGTNAHYRWCHNRYRSYREWDNSWQPYHGSRRQCISPYVR